MPQQSFASISENYILDQKFNFIDVCKLDRTNLFFATLFAKNNW